MKMFSKWLCPSLFALACSANSELALAEVPQFSQLSQCAWPIELSPEGYGNVLGPDDLARYWLAPFDTNYDTMKIEGFYPNARYFSFVVYNADPNGRLISVAGHKYDAIIKSSDQSSAPNSPIKGDSYTICVTRNATQCTNTIKIADNPVWVAFRIYVPSADKALTGRALQGGQPLPKITLLGGKGSQSLEACPLTKKVSANDKPPPILPVPSSPTYYYDKSINKLSDIRTFLDIFFPPPLDIYTPTDWYDTAADRLWFAPPKDPPIILGPNPDNKYLGMSPGMYQPGRVIVINGKAPTFPDTYNGSPRSSWGSRSPDMRYWSMCNYDLALPVMAVRCLEDQTAAIQNGYYTLVISDDLIRPNWLLPSVNWLPWGDEQYPKVVFFRNMIPVARNDTNYTRDEVPFPYAIQWVVEGCPLSCKHPNAIINFDLPYLPPRADFAAAGPYAQQIMADYYPIAFWCDKSTFIQGGWRACIKR